MDDAFNLLFSLGPAVLLAFGLRLLLPVAAAEFPESAPAGPRTARRLCVAGGVALCLTGSLWILIAADRPQPWWPVAANRSFEAVLDGAFDLFALGSIAAAIVTVAARSLKQACLGACVFGAAHAGICLVQGAWIIAIGALALTALAVIGCLAASAATVREFAQRFASPHCREPLLGCLAAGLLAGMLWSVSDAALRDAHVRNPERLRRVIERRKQSMAANPPAPTATSRAARILIPLAAFLLTAYAGGRHLWPRAAPAVRPALRRLLARRDGAETEETRCSAATPQAK